MHFLFLWTDVDTDKYVGSDEKKDFPLDSYGDEMAPSQNRIQKWTNTYLYNNTYVSSTPLCFYLEKGENEINIENVSSGGLALGKLMAQEAKTNVASYKDYAGTASGCRVSNSGR